MEPRPRHKARAALWPRQPKVDSRATIKKCHLSLLILTISLNMEGPKVQNWWNSICFITYLSSSFFMRIACQRRLQQWQYIVFWNNAISLDRVHIIQLRRLQNYTCYCKSIVFVAFLNHSKSEDLALHGWWFVVQTWWAQICNKTNRISPILNLWTFHI